MYTAREQAVTIGANGHRKGITAVAEALGVTYSHLHAVLAGKRVSARLMAKIKLTHPELLEGLTR